MTEDLDTELEQKKQNATLTATELMKQVQELMNEFTDDESGTADKLRDALMANFDKVGTQLFFFPQQGLSLRLW